MAMKTQTEVFRGFGQTGETTAQTAVECRFGEVETVLSAHASVALVGAEAGNGEVRFSGKAYFSVVYEDAEKRVCRAEKGVEFSARAQDEKIFPAVTPRVFLSVENVSVRREGASVYVTALVGADVALYGEQTFEYLAGGDLILKREPVSVLCAHLASGSTEAEDEFETELVGDVLMHAETVAVTDATCSAGVLRAEGEVSLNVLALKGENALVSFERLVPFTAELACEGAETGNRADVRVSVERAVLRAEPDEERGNCKIFAELTLNIDGCVYEEVVLDGVTDAFSPDCRVKLTYGGGEARGAGDVIRATERVAGRAALSGEVNFSDTLQAVTLQRAEANLVSDGEGKRVEGVAMATLLVLGADGSHRGVEMSLPFSVPVQTEEDCRVSVLACGTSARQRQEGEIDAEATLRLCLTEERRLSVRLVSAAEEGEKIERSQSAVSVYVPRAGDGLWELSKSLGKPPEEVSASNPDLEFPIREGQRVVVYRKKEIS